MSNIRIKDLSTEATSLGTDDFIPVDGNTSGTRKISKENLGTTLEIPDVGTAPNQVPLNSMLSGMAYMSPDSVSMGTVEITDKIDGSVEITDEDNCTLTLRSDSDNNSASRNTQIMFQVDAGTTKGLVSYDQDADVMQMSYGGNNKHLVVDSSGRTGIGTSSPDKLIHGSGAGEQTLRLENTTTSLGDGDVIGSIEFEANDSSTNGSGVVSKIQSESLNATGNLFGLSFHTGHGGSLNENMVLDNDGRLGIGTASPGDLNSAADDLVVGDGSGHRGITVYAGTGSGSSVYFADGTTGADEYRGFISYDHATNALKLGSDGTTRWSIDSSGNLVAAAASDILMPDNLGAALEIKEGANPYFRFVTTNGSEKIEAYKSISMTTGVGIDFGSTVFDTYEEGLYSATLTPSTSGTITLDGSVNAISYTIIGRVAHIQGKVNVTAVSSPVGDYVKLNLPAAIDVPDINEDSGKTVGTVSIIGAAGAMNDYVLLAVEGEAYLRIYKGTSSSPVATAPDFNGDEAVYINASYIIS